MSEKWLIAKSKPHKGTFLESNLSRLGAKTYYPRIISPTKRGHQLEPLFPSYIFCKTDTANHIWPQVRNAAGLAYFLGDGLLPTPVSENVVEHIVEKVNYWNEEGFRNRFAPGDRVAVTYGPFNTLDGIFVRYLPAHQRCVVLLEIMGKAANVEIAETTLKAIYPNHGQFRLQSITLTSG